MKVVTSVAVWDDAVGKRLSITYSEIDEAMGKIISDNNRFDRVVTDNDVVSAANALKTYAQALVNNL